MGKKAKLYLIILVNLLAWGYVGYKVYGALQGNDDVELTYEKANISKIDETIKNDSVVLSLNYSDPFLKGGNFSRESHHVKASSNSGATNTVSNKIAVPKSIKPITPTVTVQPTIIKYYGLVKNNDKGTQTAMVNVNGKSVFVKLNDNIEGFIIKTIYKDSIIALKGKEKLIIKK